jgi:hypothetical protein
MICCKREFKARWRHFALAFHVSKEVGLGIYIVHDQRIVTCELRSKKLPSAPHHTVHLQLSSNSLPGNRIHHFFGTCSSRFFTYDSIRCTAA